MTSPSLAGERSAAADRDWRIDVVVLVKGADSFLLRADGPRLTCLSVVGRSGAADLRTLVEQQVAQRWQVTVKYLGLLDFRAPPGEPGVVVVAAMAEAVLPDAGLRMLTLADVTSRRSDLDHAECFDTAHRWRSVIESTADLDARVRQAIDGSIEYLAGHQSMEDGLPGWSLYLDGNSVGLLSTAEAVQAHVYAGIRGPLVEQAATTLERLQNADGGWRIGRSLVGGASDRSVVESTAECLLALAGAGRGESESVHRGLAWLENAAVKGGGWASVGGATEGLVYPTTMAVRALSRLGRGQAANTGVAWLRRAQRKDGGWGEERGEGSSEPAYTAYAVTALLDAGIDSSDSAVTRGCDHLRRTFEGKQAEPWPGATSIAVIDPQNNARLEYRHFATPWAIVALCRAGGDVGDSVVLAGLQALLALQNDDNSWRCALAPKGRPPVWATHDAVLALSVVRDATRSRPRPVALDRYLAAERAVANRVIGSLFARQDTGSRGRRRGWLLNAWLSVLSVTVILVALAEIGVLRQIESSSTAHRIWAAVGSILLTVFGAVAPQLLTEEYRIRRRRRATG